MTDAMTAGPYLVPADVEELLPLLDTLDEMLITQVCGPAVATGDDAWQLPEEITDPRIAEAWSRIYHGITGAVRAVGDDDGFLAPDGTSYTPLALAALDGEDVRLLRAVDAQLQTAVAEPGTPGRGRTHEDLDELLDQVADDWSEELKGPKGERRNGAYLAGLLHRLLELLDLSGQARTQRLRRLVADGAERLEEADAAAYRDLANSFIFLLGGDHLDRYRYYGTT